MILAPQQSVHLPYSSALGDNDILQYGLQPGTDAEPQGIFRHVYCALVVGDHFPHKVGADIVVGAGVVHFREHIAGDLFEPVLIQAQILVGIDQLAAGFQSGGHLPDALLLHGDDVFSYVAQRAAGIVF